MWKYACLSLLALGACGPGVPDSGAMLDSRPVDIGTGVGYGGYASYEAARLARERELRGGGSPDRAFSDDRVISTEELSAAGLPVSDGPLPTAPRTAGSTAMASSANVSNPGISDEQNFDAVSSRETIESDAERLAAQAEAYRVIQPTAVPTRRGTEGPNIVAYALETSNARGEPLYRRRGIGLQSRSARACARYPSPDLAQQAFLERGGPERDRLNLDPDGDGFACAWDPAPFRAARG